MYSVFGLVVNFGLFLYYIAEALLNKFIPVKYRAKDIKGQIALVTGAGGGIGRHLAVKLARLGCIVVCWDIDNEANLETVRSVKMVNGEVHSYHVDLTKKSDVYRVADRVKKEVGKVSILINNAGVLVGKPLLECTDEQIQFTFNVNIMSQFWTTKSFLPDMIEQKKGHIVTMAGMGGMNGLKKLVAYCSSKFATIGFNESLRMELAELDGGSKVNTSIICPFFVRTPLVSGVRTKLLPLLEPEDVAQRTIDALLTNQSVCLIPDYLALAFVLKSILPVKASQLIDVVLGTTEAMDNFQGKAH